jgi:hypothetical protein
VGREVVNSISQLLGEIFEEGKGGGWHLPLPQTIFLPW